MLEKNRETIEEILKPLNNLQAEYKTNVKDELLDLKKGGDNIIELEQKIRDLEQKVKDVSKDIELLREKIKSIEETINNHQFDNITKNAEIIEQILTQLRSLESEYKNIIVGELLKE